MPDMNRRNWGNLYANIQFLDDTKTLASQLQILEIGCGRCALMEELKNRGHDVIAVDADDEVVQKSPEHLEVIQAMGDDLPFSDASFDAVLSFDVFEHIPNSDRHLAEVRRVLKPGGHYLMQTPNKWTNIPFEMVRWSTRYGIRKTFDFLKPPQHCSLHSYNQLRKRLEKAGFSVEFFDVPVVNEYFVEKVRTYLGRSGVALLKIINPDRMPLFMRTNFYVKARRLDNIPEKASV